MDVEALAQKIHALYKSKPESQHIAGELAMIELSQLVDRVRPQSVLEIGAGIGTITHLLLSHPARPQQLSVTEDHPTCLVHLAKNLEGLDQTGLSILRKPDQLEMSHRYDLVIFDGTLDNERQYLIFTEGTWCFVEGSRSKTIGELKKSLERRGLSIEFENRRPKGHKWIFRSKRTILGYRLPAIKRKRIKGCSFGQVVTHRSQA